MLVPSLIVTDRFGRSSGEIRTTHTQEQHGLWAWMTHPGRRLADRQKQCDVKHVFAHVCTCRSCPAQHFADAFAEELTSAIAAIGQHQLLRRRLHALLRLHAKLSAPGALDALQALDRAELADALELAADEVDASFPEVLGCTAGEAPALQRR